jgi:hypothetical protein
MKYICVLSEYYGILSSIGYYGGIMFNFQNLNDYEFEIVSKDILEKDTGLKFRTFTKGRDGGIDIKGYIHEGIIAQAKHYIGSAPSKVISSMKSELKKVKKLNPEKYYIFTSRGLSPDNIDEIYEIYKDYMDSKENIYDGTRIDDLLNQDEYKDIVKKHYKLWLVSSNVLDLVLNQNLFIDTEDLMYDIENESKLFIKTSGYVEALKILNKERLLILQGNPGTGKTTISKMLVLFYASKGYKVKYSSDSSIKDLKKSLSQSNDTKEILLLDDFLGQHYLKLKEERPNEIKTLVSYIIRNPNKRLILNSRITILREAVRRSQVFKSLIEDKETSKYIIDLDSMSNTEKAEILYNHMYFKSLPSEYFEQIKKDERYRKIINHKNYNPRIIEFVTKKNNYTKIDDKNYYKYIIGKLDNPFDIWEEEFEERIDKVDRIILFCLYSLTDKYIDETILKKCFINWTNYENVDRTKDLFVNSLMRLTESMIRLIEENGHKYIGVINPSVNDYLYHKIFRNEIIIDDIIGNAIYFEQFLKIENINEKKIGEKIKEWITDDKFFNLEGRLKTKEYYFLEQVNRFNIKQKNLKDTIHIIMLTEKTYLIPSPQEIRGIADKDKVTLNLSGNASIELLKNTELYKFYDLGKLIFDADKLRVLLENFNYDDIGFLILIYEEIFISKSLTDEFWDEFIKVLEVILSESSSIQIEKIVISELEDELSEIVSELYFDVDSDIKTEYYNGENDLLEKIIREGIEIEAHNKIKLKAEELGSGFITINPKVDVDKYISELSFMDDLYSIMNPEPDDYDDEDYSSGNHFHGDSDIDVIFQREYD